MRFKEFLLDVISENFLVEMATSQKEVKRKCAELSEPICMQICKILYFDSPNNLPHWSSNLDGMIENLQNLIIKGSGNKRPTSRQYRNWLFFEIYELNENWLDRRFKNLIKLKYSSIKFKREYNKSEAWNFIINELFSENGKLLNDLSKGNFNTTILDYFEK